MTIMWLSCKLLLTVTLQYLTTLDPFTLLVSVMQSVNLASGHFQNPVVGNTVLRIPRALSEPHKA